MEEGETIEEGVLTVRLLAKSIKIDISFQTRRPLGGTVSHEDRERKIRKSMRKAGGISG